MTAYADAAALAKDPTFVDRVTMAMILAGGQVAIEDKSGFPDTQTAPLRNGLAVKVLNDPLPWGKIFAWLVMFHPAARDPAVTDDKLTQIILWEWNAVSGAGQALTPQP